MWSVKFEVWSAKSAVCSVRCGVSREGHGRDRVSLNYRSFMFGKLPPPACPGLCYVQIEQCSRGFRGISKKALESLGQISPPVRRSSVMILCFSPAGLMYRGACNCATVPSSNSRIGFCPKRKRNLTEDCTIYIEPLYQIVKIKLPKKNMHGV